MTTLIIKEVILHAVLMNGTDVQDVGEIISRLGN